MANGRLEPQGRNVFQTEGIQTHTPLKPRGPARAHIKTAISRLENNFRCLGKPVNSLGSNCYLTPLLMMPWGPCGGYNLCCTGYNWLYPKSAWGGEGGSCGCVAMDVGAGVVVGGGRRGDIPPSKSPELGAALVIEKCAPRAAEWFGCGFSRGCSSGSKAGLWPVPGTRGPGPTRRLDRPLVARRTAPWWQTPGHCLRAPISQCPGTTGYNENKALPFPRHGNAPQYGEAPAAFGHPSGGFWGPVLTPRRPRIGHEG
jgi:hypothetical protein